MHKSEAVSADINDNPEENATVEAAGDTVIGEADSALPKTENID